mmetsp:Transcript_27940/g.54959  ORF Transcript_27940/g.54959 Transcript_27940/m.54959 type:complete len:127 (+) Transcript_27940:212-592(+)
MPAWWGSSRTSAIVCPGVYHVAVPAAVAVPPLVRAVYSALGNELPTQETGSLLTTEPPPAILAVPTQVVWVEVSEFLVRVAKLAFHRRVPGRSVSAWHWPPQPLARRRHSRMCAGYGSAMPVQLLP